MVSTLKEPNWVGKTTNNRSLHYRLSAMDRAPHEPTKGGEGKKKFRESFEDKVTQNLIF